MLKFKICFLLFFCIVLFCAGKVYAETVYLKSGKSVEGKIVEKTEISTKIDIGGAAITYFNNEIERIEESSDLPTPEGELYTNKEYGFEIRGPKGWFRRAREGGREGEVIFAKQEEGFGLPILGVTTDIAPAQVKTALDFASLVLPSYEEAINRHQGTFKLVEPITEIEANGFKGARFIYEVSGSGGKAMRSIDCKFIKDNLIVSIQGMAYSEDFETNLKDFKEAINSFKFI
jgi:hypothetical protein